MPISQSADHSRHRLVLFRTACTHALTGRRLVISGQIGVHPRWYVAERGRSQLDLAWANPSRLRAADMETRHLVKGNRGFSTRPTR